MLALLMLLAFVGQSTRVNDYDLIELNHYRAADGSSSYDQIVCWNWSPDYRRYDVDYWTTSSGKSLRIAADGSCHVFWLDPRRHVEYKLRSRLFRETWTTVDPELRNQAKWKPELRGRILQFRVAPPGIEDW